MWMRHDTPENVAKLLAAHAPKSVKSILDPSAGSGILVRSFLENKGVSRVECIDIDPKAVSDLDRNFGHNKVFFSLNADFLEWSSPEGQGYRKRYDCIIMNPPFGGSKQRLVPIEVGGKLIYVPIETAFVYRSLRLLKPGGRILAILPASVISGQGSEWLRKILLKAGAIRLVHELPHRTFSGVEGRMYNLVFEQGALQRKISLANHRLVDPEMLSVSHTVLRSAPRFDFAFHDSQKWSNAVQAVDFGWIKLGDIATIFRGRKRSPVDIENTLHTTNFDEGENLPPYQRSFTKGVALLGDILIKRVGRYISLSPMLFQGQGPIRCSDCILIVRPNSFEDRYKILFALRSLISWQGGSGLIEQGIGASYIPMDALKQLDIPLELDIRLEGGLRAYQRAANMGNTAELIRLEEKARLFMRRSGNGKAQSRSKAATPRS